MHFKNFTKLFQIVLDRLYGKCVCVCDNVYHNFVDSYQRGGDPLLITDNPQYVPKTYHCKNCGSQCVFEFQILPQLIHILQSAIREKLHDGSASQYLKYEAVEYGTVLVYTCSKSCWSNNTSDSTSTNNSTSNNLWVEEVVVVQPDLDTPLIDTIAV